MPVTGNLTITTRYDSTSTTATAGTATETVNRKYDPAWQPGTAANQFDRSASLSGTLATSTNTHVLSAFPSVGGNIAFVKVRELWIENTGAVAMKVTPGGSQPWVAAFASDVLIPPGAIVVFAAPGAGDYAVTSGSADKFTAVSAGSTTYKVIIKGASA